MSLFLHSFHHHRCKIRNKLVWCWSTAIETWTLWLFSSCNLLKLRRFNNCRMILKDCKGVGFFFFVCSNAKQRCFSLSHDYKELYDCRGSDSLQLGSHFLLQSILHLYFIGLITISISNFLIYKLIAFDLF